MEGRFHRYEGYSLEEVAFPVRVMKRLGAGTLIISNAAGGMNPLFEAGDLMLITDHINFMGESPLIGVNDERLGPRFPDMSQPYDRRLLTLAEEVAREEKIKIQQGVYVAVTGPNLETAAEYRFLRLIGADAVGMSTVPEVIVAVQAEMRVLGISCITDECLPDALKPADIRVILKVAAGAEPKLTQLMSRVIQKL
jgi:purine-nucleoside phosphorylase